MAKLQHLYKLFDAHTNDLKDTINRQDEIILCPICLQKFYRTDVDNKSVNDGHVWPKDLRKKSIQAGKMQVLLCKKCNSKSSRADNQMQLFDKVKSGDQTGKLHGARLVEFVEDGTDEPAQAHVNVELGENSLHVTGRLDENGRFMYSSPEDQERLKSIFAGGRKVNISIHPPSNYYPGIVHGGWITSAYLMAFYALGYRYILQPGTQVIRDYILDSFENKSSELPLPTDENFTVQTFVDKVFPDPLISVVFPPGDVAKVYISVAFLDVNVLLPFRYDPNIFHWILNHTQKTEPEKMQKIWEKQHPLELRIQCTKTVVHECIFDLLLGKKPTPGGNYGLAIAIE